MKTMLKLDSVLNKGKYAGQLIRSILSKDPHFLYKLYIQDPSFDLHLDVIIMLEKKGFNMKKAILRKLKNLQQTLYTS